MCAWQLGDYGTEGTQSWKGSVSASTWCLIKKKKRGWVGGWGGDMPARETLPAQIISQRASDVTESPKTS